MSGSDDAARYQILGTLGRGGMGVVLRARERSSGRELALKLAEEAEARPERLERFRREGVVTAALRHPGIVQVHASGLIQGRPYLAYELVEGCRELGEVFRTADLRRRVELVRDAAEAVGYAHGQGVVHRDLKPANLLVDRTGRLRVADFGLAVRDDLERLTRTGALVGTPAWMAPEQFQGRGGHGPWTDVWALGVLLFQACTDELPFEGRSLLELAAQTAHGPASPRTLTPDLPLALEAICLRALAPAPERRYPEASALAADLSAWLEGRAVAAASRPASRLLLVGAGASAALLAVALAAWRSAPLPDPLAPAPSASPPAPPAANVAPMPGAAAVASAPSPSPSPSSGPASERPRVTISLDPERAEGLDPDVAAVKFLADQGEPNAMVQLGNYCLQGKGGLPQDPARARELYERAAAADSDRARARLADLLLDGRGGPADPPRALALLRQAVERRYAFALVRLAEVLAEGRHAPRDLPEAARLYRMALHTDERRTATVALSILLEEGGPGVPPDRAEARRLLESLQAPGDLQAQFLLGRHLHRCGTPDERRLGLALIGEASAAGCVPAGHYLDSLR